MAGVEVRNELPGVAAGIVVIRNCQAPDSPLELKHELDAAVRARASDPDDPVAMARKAAVRDLLRHGSYKPTGRAKPASEYLVRAATEGSFPLINVLADINNLISLESLLPITIVDMDRAGSEQYAIRWGRDGEKYVFNPSGQELDLRDLLLVSILPEDRPCGSPVKDSQATKTDGDTRSALAIVWGPESLRPVVQTATARMAALLERYAGGSVESWITDSMAPGLAGQGKA
jgi:DNA/RNA-binding domain of Phe-tRNA-synthetase-like protein